MVQGLHTVESAQLKTRQWMAKFSSKTGADGVRITHRGICTIEDATMHGEIFKQNRSRWCKDHTPWNLHYRRRDNAWRYFYQKIQKYRWRGRDWKRVKQDCGMIL